MIKQWIFKRRERKVEWYCQAIANNRRLAYTTVDREKSILCRERADELQEKLDKLRKRMR